MKKLPKKIINALKEARKIEKEKLLPEKEVVAVYKEGISTLDKLKKFLKPAWFLSAKKEKKKR